MLASKHGVGAIRATLALVLAFAVSPTWADWHAGRITRLGFGYDGSTITLQISDWSRSNCTCYSVWPNQRCLDRNRATFKEEFAWLLRARAMDAQVQVHIDEGTCRVVALFEVG